MTRSRLLPLAPLLLIALACGALLFRQPDLTNSDLGRHLKNGEIVVQGSRAQAAAVLHTNFYSYTASGYPLVNHHWLTGVVFFLVWKMASYQGLTVLYAGLVALALGVSYWTAQRASNPLVASALVALAIPLVTLRDQIRPEAFTYLLTALFYGVLLAWERGWMKDQALVWLPCLMLPWINLHVEFVFGFVLLGAFALRLWAESADRARWIRFGLASAACAAAALVNPSGSEGVLYPLHIFGNYGYDIAENLSLSGLSARNQWSWEDNLFLALLGLAAAVCLWRWLASKPGKSRPYWPQAVLLAGFGLGGVLMVRNQPLFGLLMTPLVAELLADRVGPEWGMKGSPRWVVLAACGAGLLLIATELQDRPATFGFGLRPNVNNAAGFLRANAITGPVFNDFDIGAYLIYNGYQVFVDGRPEAYPPGFFQNDYIPALSDDSVWLRLDRKYRFNAIAISMQDGFPPIEKFILRRVRDDDWAPVYTDAYTLIFVRRTDQNAAVIQAHLIPRSVFR
jgi:hypothetical protein